MACFVNFDCSSKNNGIEIDSDDNPPEQLLWHAFPPLHTVSIRLQLINVKLIFDENVIIRVRLNNIAHWTNHAHRDGLWRYPPRWGGMGFCCLPPCWPRHARGHKVTVITSKNTSRCHQPKQASKSFQCVGSTADVFYQIIR